MKLEKKDALWLVLSVVLSIFIIGVFASQAFSVFAETVDFGDTSGYVVCTSEAYANANGDVAKYCCTHGVTCLYKNSRSELVLVDENENAFIGIWWNDTSYSTSASGAFTSGSSVYNDAYYYFNIGYIGNATFLSVYPMFDNEEYALRYADGDSSYLQYATNLDDLPLNLDDTLQDYISNVYFSYVGTSSAQFQIELSQDCPEGLILEVEPTSLAYLYGWTTSGVKLNNTDWSKIPSQIYSGSTSDGTINGYFDIDEPSKFIELGNASNSSFVGYSLTSKLQRSNFYCPFVKDTLSQVGAKLYIGGMFYDNKDVEEYYSSPSAVFNGTIPMLLDDSISITGPTSGHNLPYSDYSTQGCVPAGFQIRCRIVDRSGDGLATASPYVYLTSNVDGSVVSSGSFVSVPRNPGQNITRKDSNGLSYTTPTNTSGIEGFENGSIDNSNIIPYIQSGFGLSGSNGLIALYRQVFNFLPSEIWSMIFFALGLSIILMIIKVLRGM